MAKIHYPKLQKWLDEGISQAEIARRYKVNPSSVCKAVRRLNKGNAKVVTQKAIPAIVDNKIDIMQQIRGINEKMQRHLDLIDEEISKDGQDAKDKMQLRDQMVKYVAEIRKQMSTLLDISKTLYNAEEVQAFQRIVLQAIGEADPDTKKKIISELQKARSVGRAISDSCYREVI
jgi:non-homologous end joining protein Ku